MSWQTTEIGGKTADVLAFDDDPAGVVMFLHGHGRGTLRDNRIWTDQFRRRRIAVVCPHGQRSWWLDRICTEFDHNITPMAFLRDTVAPWIRDRWNGCPIGLVGVSMGGQGVLQLAYRHAREFPVVGALAPAIDFHQLHGLGLPLDEMFATVEDVRQSSVVLQIHPLDWPRHQLIVCDPADTDWYEGADRLVMKLSSSGIIVERDLETSHGGHSWEYFDHMADKVIGFVADHL